MLYDLGMRRISTIVLSFAAACGGNHGSAPDAAVDSPPDAPQPTTIDLKLDRTAGSSEFDATAQWLDEAGQPIAGPDIAISAGGTSGTGHVHVTPTGPGQIPVTATSGSASVAKTAVVLATVDETWNQPELVRGLVNTGGWEDGPSISPDGQTLVLQYLPVSIDCIIGGDATKPACKIVGPTGAPERPGMPGANRVNADGTYTNSCPGFSPPSTVVVPPNAEWAFTRQPDGSFASPRPVFYDGSDGCFGTFGLFIGGDGAVTWAFDNPLASGAKLHTDTSLSLAASTVLGTFVVGQTITLTGEVGAQLPLNENMAEGNPWLGDHRVLFDDEAGRKDLMFSTETNGTWAAVKTIAAPVSDPNAQESQPFLDGTTLLFRRELVVLASDWNGGAMDQAASWTTPRTILAPGADVIDGITAVGEPSVATTAHGRELYFVFAHRVSATYLDLDIAMVPAR